MGTWPFTGLERPSIPGPPFRRGEKRRPISRCGPASALCDMAISSPGRNVVHLWMFLEHKISSKKGWVFYLDRQMLRSPIPGPYAPLILFLKLQAWTAIGIPGKKSRGQQKKPEALSLWTLLLGHKFSCKKPF
jgi:hypothetical protein